MKIGQVMRILFNPIVLVTDSMAKFAWYFALIVPGITFCLFFFQTGIDMNKAVGGSILSALLLGLMGLIFGVVLIPIIAMITLVFGKAFGCKWDVKRTIKAFSFAYGGSLVYMLLGVLMNLVLGWKTAMAFGVTGVLWSMGPIYSVIREMFNGKNFWAATAATFAGILLLFGWAFIGGI
jgi:hypothetical protein